MWGVRWARDTTNLLCFCSELGWAWHPTWSNLHHSPANKPKRPEICHGFCLHTSTKSKQLVTSCSPPCPILSHFSADPLPPAQRSYSVACVPLLNSASQFPMVANDSSLSHLIVTPFSLILLKVNPFCTKMFEKIMMRDFASSFENVKPTNLNNPKNTLISNQIPWNLVWSSLKDGISSSQSFIGLAYLLLGWATNFSTPPRIVCLFWIMNFFDGWIIKPVSPKTVCPTSMTYTSV